MKSNARKKWKNVVEMADLVIMMGQQTGNGSAIVIERERILRF